MKKLIFIFLLLSVSGYSQTIVDSYSETYGSNSGRVGCMGTSYSTEYGQSFTCNSNCNITSAKFHLTRVGSPTGNAYACLYAHSGTYGTSSVPTGSALATSDAVALSTLSTSPTYTLITFTFSGGNQYTMTAGTHYVITIKNTNAIDDSNYPLYHFDNTTKVHSGNRTYGILNSSCVFQSWSYSSNDVIFYVYGSCASAPSPGYLFIGY